jgi:hypothetical protein
MTTVRGLLLVGCAAAIAASPGRAAAADVGAPGTPLSVEVHAFASQGALVTTNNDYLVRSSTKGSFQLSEVGINFTHDLTDNLRLGLQLFAQDFAQNNNSSVQADWFYLDYRPFDWLGLRAGRLKIPFGLSNEYNDIDSARVPILLPQSVYPLQTRQFLFAQTGFEAYGFVRAAWAGALDYRLFSGTLSLDPSQLFPPEPFQLEINVPFVTGGRVMWETPIEGLRAGGSVEDVELDVTASGLPMPTPTSPSSGYITNRSLLWVASAEYTLGDAVLSAEYSRWHSKQDSNVEPGSDSESERLYAMLTYRATPWYQLGAYYSLLFPYVDNRWGNTPPASPTAPTCYRPRPMATGTKTACWQHDVSLTARFDLTPNWLVKLEAHFMDGTAGLTNPLSVSAPPVGVRDWAVFLAKTTVYF